MMVLMMMTMTVTVTQVLDESTMELDFWSSAISIMARQLLVVVAKSSFQLLPFNRLIRSQRLGQRQEK